MSTIYGYGMSPASAGWSLPCVGTRVGFPVLGIFCLRDASDWEKYEDNLKHPGVAVVKTDIHAEKAWRGLLIGGLGSQTASGSRCSSRCRCRDWMQGLKQGGGWRAVGW